MDLKGRSFLTLLDFNKEEIRYMLDLAHELKAKKKKGILGEELKGKNSVLVWDKSSTRTRCSFEVAAMDEGAHVTYLTNSHMNKKESIEDTAKVFGRMYDAIEYRGFGQDIVEDLQKYSGVPVWNGLTDEDHPTQILADFLTIQEHLGKLKGVKLVYMGDGRNNMANALMIGSSKMGLDFVICSPKELFPEESLVEECKKNAEQSGASITITADVAEAVKNADVLYTDVWCSMGEEDKAKERIALLSPYQINSDVMAMTGKDNTLFMHCLPAIKGKEVTEEVFESAKSVVFDEAENRMHTIKAVMVTSFIG